jgi:hypothetical protein
MHIGFRTTSHAASHCPASSNNLSPRIDGVRMPRCPRTPTERRQVLTSIAEPPIPSIDQLSPPTHSSSDADR